MEWYCYILECSDGSLYTGITTELERRLHEHNTGLRSGSKYTFTRRPVKLVYFEKLKTKSSVLRRELEIKRWTRTKKQELITSFIKLKNN